jgi:hypothetical protein
MTDVWKDDRPGYAVVSVLNEGNPIQGRTRATVIKGGFETEHMARQYERAFHLRNKAGGY